MYFKSLKDKNCLINVDELTHITLQDNRVIFWVDELMIEAEVYPTTTEAKQAFRMYEQDLCEWP
jgi:hypothetical protein